MTQHPVRPTPATPARRSRRPRPRGHRRCASAPRRVATDTLGAGQPFDRAARAGRSVPRRPAVPDRPRRPTVRSPTRRRADADRPDPEPAPAPRARRHVGPEPTPRPPTPDPDAGARPRRRRHRHRPGGRLRPRDPQGLVRRRPASRWSSPSSARPTPPTRPSARSPAGSASGRATADSHNGDWGPAAMALALEAYGAPGYEVRAFETPPGRAARRGPRDPDDRRRRSSCSPGAARTPGS